MRIELNGEWRELPEDASVADAVEAAGAPRNRRGIAVAVDGAVVPRSAWNGARVRDGQKIEVLQARQGG